ncbi:hypothetical protein [Streptomyces venezuelae]|uniref:hypothetical protein n=1 Tax=Streptomyces venezuelae TaxID=54571 RepID=UPI000D876C3D|nr:hypothetical protein [Streptomyces venezuelae]
MTADQSETPGSALGAGGPAGAADSAREPERPLPESGSTAGAASAAQSAPASGRTASSGSPAVAAPGTSGPAGTGSAVREAERPFLQRPQGIIAVIGGVIAALGGVLGLVFLLFPDLQPRPDSGAEVTVVDVDLAKEEEIRADWTSAGGEETGKTTQWKASLVTVVLRNSGENPALVSQAEFDFSYITQVGCPYGASGLEVKARYDVKVPTTAKVPFKQIRKLKYSLPPHEQERIAFTVGPETAFDGSLPSVYTFTITLRLDDGSSFTTPKMTYMDPSGSASVLEAGEQVVQHGEKGSFTTVACLKEQEHLARELSEGSSYVSAELKRYSSKLTGLVGRLPQGA